MGGESDDREVGHLKGCRTRTLSSRVLRSLRSPRHMDLGSAGQLPVSNNRSGNAHANRRVSWINPSTTR